LTAEVSGKRLEILKKVVPGLSRAAVLWNSANPALVFSWKETQGAARVLGVTLQSHEVQGPKDFAAAFAAIAEERPHALLVLQDAVTIQHRKEIIDFAIQKRLPSMFNEKEWESDLAQLCQAHLINALSSSNPSAAASAGEASGISEGRRRASARN
jgi:putative tryptophan/tyrosine transport system substrate-binding protein